MKFEDWGIGVGSAIIACAIFPIDDTDFPWRTFLLAFGLLIYGIAVRDTFSR